MMNQMTKRTMLLALGLAIGFLAPVARVYAADVRIESITAAPPAVNERYPRPGEGFGWPPSFWNEMNNPAPATTPQTPYYEQTDSLPWVA